jgi:hypothetical protein
MFSELNDLCQMLNARDISDAIDYMPTIKIEVRRIEDNLYLIANEQKQASLESIDTWGHIFGTRYQWDKPVKKSFYCLEHGVTIEHIIEILLAYTQSLVFKKNQMNWTTINFREPDLYKFIESIKGKTKTQIIEAVIDVHDQVLCDMLNKDSRVVGFFKVNAVPSANIYHMEIGNKQVINDEEIIPVTFMRIEAKIENTKAYLAWLCDNRHVLFHTLQCSTLHGQTVLSSK